MAAVAADSQRISYGALRSGTRDWGVRAATGSIGRAAIAAIGPERFRSPFHEVVNEASERPAEAGCTSVAVCDVYIENDWSSGGGGSGGNDKHQQ